MNPKKKVNDNYLNKAYNKFKTSWNVVRYLTNKSKVSCEKHSSHNDFNNYCIDSVIALKQLAAFNSFGNAANLLRNSPYVDANFEWSHVYPHNVVKSFGALKTPESIYIYDLPNDILKHIVCEIAISIANIINKQCNNSHIKKRY
jgi:hypothetical protein